MPVDSVMSAFSAALTPTLAVFAAFIAWRQHRLDVLKTKQALFDRRLAFYQTTMAFINRMLVDGQPSTEELIAFRQKADEASFLFDEEMWLFLDDLFKKALALRKVQRQLAVPSNQTDEKSRALVADKDAELFEWFTEQMKTTRQRFAPFLTLTL